MTWWRRLQWIWIVCVLLVLVGASLRPIATSVAQVGSAPTISPLTVLTPDPVERYAHFEIAFAVTSASATNPYFPYDPAPPAGVPAGVGLTVDILVLPPGQSDWDRARVQPCFYFQPYQEVGTGVNAGLAPVGEPEWRCRLMPDAAGVWQYRVRAVDAGGTAISPTRQFTCVASTRKGFIRVSPTDSRFFEFADGTPFTAPLINVEEGNPFNSLVRMRQNLQKMGENGIRFVRWFPTGEGANFAIVPFGDSLSMSWRFGNSASVFDEVDSAAGKLFSFKPYYYSAQVVPALPGARYRLSFRAKVVGEQVLRPQIGSTEIDICSATSPYHEANGNNDSCDFKRDGWHDYVLEVVNSTNLPAWTVYLHALYAGTDAPAPYNTVQSGKIRIHSIRLQRDETGNGDWGPNLLSRGDPDTYAYVDQVAAARLDELLRVSEQYGVYHKLTLFHKNDQVLNRFLPDGTISATWDPDNRLFYSQEGQAARWYENAYIRYFLARWSASPALHSLELANENNLIAESYEAGFAFAQRVDQWAARPLLVSNSFWGWFVDPFFADPAREGLIDYSDKHWYANPSGAGTPDRPGELISRAYADSAAYVRECWARFREYANALDLREPIVRGEGGVAQANTQPQHPDIAREVTGTYYHKKLWAHVGVPGYSCDGEWYPRLFVNSSETQFPNSAYDLARMFAAYERFLQGEPLSNGRYVEIGTDLNGANQIALTNLSGALRAWGVRDASAGRVLLWIDNANHTWKNVVDGVAIAPASATLTIPSLPAGVYTAQWWDTRAGAVVATESYSVGDDGALTFVVRDLATDKAVKFSRTSTNTPTPAPTNTPGATSSPTPAPTNTPRATSSSTPLPTNTPTPSPTLTPTPLSTRVVLTLDPPAVNVSLGAVFTVTARVDTHAQPVDGVAVALDFDPEVVRVIGVAPGAALPTVIQNVVDNTAGHFDFVAGRLGDAVMGAFPVVAVAFEAVGEATASPLHLVLDGVRRTDATYQGRSVLSEAQDGIVTVACAAVHGRIQLQGRPTAPHPRWITPLEVSLSTPGETIPRDTFTTTTSDLGTFSLTSLAPGVYTMRVKNSHTLANAQVVTLTIGTADLDFGLLREGDANNDNAVDLLDFSTLAPAFATVAGDAGFEPQADFDVDGWVGLVDFSLLAANFGRMGDIDPRAPGDSYAVAPVVVLSLAPETSTVALGGRVHVAILVDARDQAIDGAAAYLDFDPTILRVVEIREGDALPIVLQKRFDNQAGQADIVAGILSGPVAGFLQLAEITFEAVGEAAATRIDFHLAAPRQSEATFAGLSVLGQAEGISIRSGQAQPVLPRLYLPLLAR